VQTPRGSGTNGYVQRNLSHVRKRPQVEYTEELRDRDLKAVEPRKSNPELLEHERRRKIEVECLLLEEELQERGCVPPARRLYRAPMGAPPC